MSLLAEIIDVPMIVSTLLVGTVASGVATYIRVGNLKAQVDRIEATQTHYVTRTEFDANNKITSMVLEQHRGRLEALERAPSPPPPPITLETGSGLSG